MYLNGGLVSNTTPVESFIYLRYKETVYPPEIYANEIYTRKRNSFSFNWRTDRANRSIDSFVKQPGLVSYLDDNGFGTIGITSSMWPLDVSEDWGTVSDIMGTKYINSIPNSDAWGILQNNYCQHR